MPAGEMAEISAPAVEREAAWIRYSPLLTTFILKYDWL
jgi:hypothetical protein